MSKPSRRTFIKAFVSVLLAAAGGGYLWRRWKDRQGSAQATPPAPVSPAGEPPAAPPPPSGVGEPVLSFFLLSDIHMTTGNPDIVAKLHMALKDISRFETPVDTMVLGGDLVDGGREGDYELLKEILSGYKLPQAYGNMGNHEYYDIWYNGSGDWSTQTGPNGKTDAQSRERFIRFMGYKDRPYHDVWVNGVHLIMLSQEAYVQERPEVGEGAWYSDEQMAWLEKTMQAHADGSPAFIFIHQPLPPEGQDGGQHRLIRAKEFRSILRPYRNVFVLSGHTHRNLETDGRYVRDTTFHWFSNASVGKTRAAGSVPSPVQGLYIQVYKDQVVVLGREFSNRSWIKAAEWTVRLA